MKWSWLLFTFVIFTHASEVTVAPAENGGWQLLVDGKSFFIKGVTYRAVKVGQSPDNGTLEDWAVSDENHNHHCDGPYDAWVDKNGNDTQDADEPAVGDFQLMKEMGVNAIRWYHNDFHGQQPHKDILRDLYQTYGIRVAIGDKFGAYTIGSGANWKEGTDYRNAKQQEKMIESVHKMVMDHKDEPYTLMWILGNENNLHFTNTNAGQYPIDYAKFLNHVAELIHQWDGKHPVAFINGDTAFLKFYHDHAPAIDIFGVNAYRGAHGFGGLWSQLKNYYNKPVLITEYGGAEAAGNDEDHQLEYHKGCWNDIAANRAGSGQGNSIGGFAYEWLDEWWKAGDPAHHAEVGGTGHQGVGAVKWNQEYCGLLSQGSGAHSPFERQLRKVYFFYQSAWLEKSNP